ncbi:MAG: hypothetical protein IPL62_20650 [Caulobacteraceae bacterium]|nr:hypothetical protein [Caulobacteraceae bacterium]
MSAGAIPLVTARRSRFARTLGPAVAEALAAPNVVESADQYGRRLWLTVLA